MNGKMFGYLCVLAALLGVLALQLAYTPDRLDQGKIIARRQSADELYSVEIVSQPYRLDRVYKSMTGPRGNQPHIRLLEEAQDDELLSLTALETSVVEANTLAPLSNEYFCHSNLTLDPCVATPESHNASMAPPAHADWRLFTLIPGRMSIRFPEGFGIPIRAGTLVDHFTMSLNQNPGHPEQIVRLRTTIQFRRGRQANEMQRLFRRSVYVYQQHQEYSPDGRPGTVLLADGHQGQDCAESCAMPQLGATRSRFVKVSGDGLENHPGAACCVENATLEGIVPQFGKENTVHWMVPPGKHSYRTEVTEQMNLPFDTTAHYVTGHLHPFGKSLKLIDLQANKTVFEITAQGFQDRLGVASMSELVSNQGIALFKGRRYELIAEYENTSPEPIDAMAILYFYARE